MSKLLNKREWLKALSEGKKVASAIWGDEAYIAMDAEGVIRYNGLTPTDINCHKDGLKLYEEPKKLVKMYKYAYKNGFNKWWQETSAFYKSIEEVINAFPNTNLKRLDYTMIEVEE